MMLENVLKILTIKMCYDEDDGDDRLPNQMTMISNMMLMPKIL